MKTRHCAAAAIPLLVIPDSPHSRQALRVHPPAASQRPGSCPAPPVPPPSARAPAVRTRSESDPAEPLGAADPAAMPQQPEEVVSVTVCEGRKIRTVGPAQAAPVFPRPQDPAAMPQQPEEVVSVTVCEGRKIRTVGPAQAAPVFVRLRLDEDPALDTRVSRSDAAVWCGETLEFIRERNAKSVLRVQLLQRVPTPLSKEHKYEEELLAELTQTLRDADALLGFDKWFKLDKKRGKGQLHLVIRFYPVVKLEDKYILGEKLGYGAQSTVYLATDRHTGRVAAAKVIDKTAIEPRDLRALEREACILKKLKHPNIVELYDVFHTRKTMALVMEHASGGELFEELSQRGRLCELDAQYVFRQLAHAVHYLHSKGIAHRDLKPENILVSKGAEPLIKLADFGLSVETNSIELNSMVGSPSYVAPEVLECKPYTMQCDCWSMGVVLYTLLSGDVPFRAEDPVKLVEVIGRGVFSLCGRCWDEVSEPAKDLVEKLIVVDPKERYTAAQCVAHPWVATCDYPSVPESPFECCSLAGSRECGYSTSSGYLTASRPPCAISPRLQMAWGDQHSVSCRPASVSPFQLSGGDPPSSRSTSPRSLTPGPYMVQCQCPSAARGFVVVTRPCACMTTLSPEILTIPTVPAVALGCPKPTASVVVPQWLASGSASSTPREPASQDTSPVSPLQFESFDY
eukprot:m51a1_g921 putative myosin light chain (685) ;mRNA; f:187180-190980